MSKITVIDLVEQWDEQLDDSNEPMNVGFNRISPSEAMKRTRPITYAVGLLETLRFMNEDRPKDDQIEIEWNDDDNRQWLKEKEGGSNV